MNQEEVTKIVALQLENLIEMLGDKGISMSWTEEAIESLSRQGFDPQFGARPIKKSHSKKGVKRIVKRNALRKNYFRK